MNKSKPKTKSKRMPIYKGDPNVYDVESILKQRKNGTKTEYFIKWLGYPDSENLWVDESDVTPDLIKSFNLMAKRQAKLKKSNTTQSFDVNANTMQSSSSTQTLDLPANEYSPVIEDSHCSDSYFEEGFHNFGPNIQLQSTADEFQLFSDSLTGDTDLSRKEV